MFSGPWSLEHLQCPGLQVEDHVRQAGAGVPWEQLGMCLPFLSDFRVLKKSCKSVDIKMETFMIMFGVWHGAPTRCILTGWLNKTIWCVRDLLLRVIFQCFIVSLFTGKNVSVHCILKLNI